MAVPDYQSVMLPLLRFTAAQDGEVSTAEAVEALELHLTEQDRREMLASGISPRPGCPHRSRREMHANKS